MKRRLLMIIFVLLFVIGSFFYGFRRRSPQLLLIEDDLISYGHLTSISPRIPRRIHQTYLSRTVPDQWNITVQSVLQHNIDFEYYLWSHEEMAQFVQEHEPEFYRDTYRHYRYEAQRIDSFRYVVLFHLGGIYIDMDNGAKRSFHSLLNTLEALDPQIHHLAAFPPDDALGLQSDFQVTTPTHPFYRQLIDRLTHFHHDYLLHHLTILLSAGPLYVTVQEHFFHASKDGIVRTLEWKMYHQMFHWKVNGATWHGRDTTILLFLFYHRQQILRILLTILISMIILILFIRCYSQRKQRSIRRLPYLYL